MAHDDRARINGRTPRELLEEVDALREELEETRNDVRMHAAVNQQWRAENERLREALGALKLHAHNDAAFYLDGGETRLANILLNIRDEVAAALEPKEGKK